MCYDYRDANWGTKINFGDVSQKIWGQVSDITKFIFGMLSRLTIKTQNFFVIFFIFENKYGEIYTFWIYHKIIVFFRISQLKTIT